ARIVDRPGPLAAAVLADSLGAPAVSPSLPAACRQHEDDALLDNVHRISARCRDEQAGSLLLPGKGEESCCLREVQNSDSCEVERRRRVARGRVGTGQSPMFLSAPTTKRVPAM